MYVVILVSLSLFIAHLTKPLKVCSLERLIQRLQTTIDQELLFLTLSNWLEIFEKSWASQHPTFSFKPNLKGYWNYHLKWKFTFCSFNYNGLYLINNSWFVSKICTLVLFIWFLSSIMKFPFLSINLHSKHAIMEPLSTANLLLNLFNAW